MGFPNRFYKALCFAVPFCFAKSRIRVGQVIIDTSDPRGIVRSEDYGVAYVIKVGIEEDYNTPVTGGTDGPDKSSYQAEPLLGTRRGVDLLRVEQL